MTDSPTEPAKRHRLFALDLIRGIAVLGILTINITAFAGPSGATLSPHIPQPASLTDEVIFALNLVAFEGKMRAIFTILFGASMELFIQRAEAAGRDGEILQGRRLGWLALFGYLHFLLFWWGDILFGYALFGLFALFLREIPTRKLLAIALFIFAAWHLGGAVESFPDVRTVERARLGTASPEEMQAVTEYAELTALKAQVELEEYRQGFFTQIAAKLMERPLWPFELALPSAGETLPLMLLGMVLYRTGFFTGGWSRRWLKGVGGLGIAIGLAATLAVLAWAWPREFPAQAMYAAIVYWLAIPHLLMGVGYMALLVLAAPRIQGTALGTRLSAAGRMAFSNYIGTTILMTALFYGWGFGLVGRLDRLEQTGVMLAVWAGMLVWSRPWLVHFRQGPLEWLWRSLTERRVLPLR